jgi:hypothetical protein
VRKSLSATALRLIAIDLDGTALNPSGIVSRRTVQAVQRAREAGLLVTFATGRNWTESRQALSQLGFQGPCVFAGGAVVCDTASGETLACRRMPRDLASALCEVFESSSLAACALQHTESDDDEYLISAELGLSDALQRWLDVTSATYRRVPCGWLIDHDHAQTVRVGVVAKPDEVSPLQREIDRRFGERVMHHAIHVAAYTVDVLEVFDRAVNKWAGIQTVARRLGVEESAIVAIGDDVNDVAMLQNAGLGIAMGNARPAALQAADRVIAGNDVDGLAQFIENLLDGRLIGTPTSLSGSD